MELKNPADLPLTVDTTGSPNNNGLASNADDLTASIAEEDEVGSQGDRGNCIITLCRVNAKGFQDRCVYVNPDTHEVELIPDKVKQKAKREAWVLDDSVDTIPSLKTSRHSTPGRSPATPGLNRRLLKFANQEEVWSRVKAVCDARLVLDSGHLSVVFIGGHGAGKSYSLYGNVNDRESRGVLPRFLEYCFSKESPFQVDFIQIQVFLIYQENIVDLLNPSGYLQTFRNNLAYSDVLGPLVLPLTTVVATSFAAALDFFLLALKTSGVVQSNECEFFSSVQFVVNFQLISNQHNRLNRVTFVEAASLLVPQQASLSVDRFAGRSLEYSSSRELYNIVRPQDATESFTKTERYERSILTYLLQDSLVKHPDCMVIGCLRAQKCSYEDNYICLDFMNRLDVGSSSRQSKDSKPSLTFDDAMVRLLNEINDCNQRAELERTKERTQQQNDGEKSQGADDENSTVSKSSGGSKMKKILPESTKAIDVLPGQFASTFFSVKAAVLTKQLWGLRLLRKGDSSSVERVIRNFNFLINREGNFDEDPICQTEEGFLLHRRFMSRSGLEAEMTPAPGFPRIASNRSFRPFESHEAEAGQEENEDEPPTFPSNLPMSETFDPNFGVSSFQFNYTRVVDSLTTWLMERGIYATNELSSMSRKPSSFGEEVSLHTSTLRDIEDPYILPIFPNGSLADEYLRIYLKRGLTLFRGSDHPIMKLFQEAAYVSTEVTTLHGATVESEAEQEDRFFSTLLLGQHSFIATSMPDDDPALQQPASSSKEIRKPTISHVIRIYGSQLEPLHCRFMQQGGMNIKLTPQNIDTGSGAALVFVNGQRVSAETILRDQDLVQLGSSRFFRVYIPRMRPEKFEDVFEESEGDVNSVALLESNKLPENALTIFERALLALYENDVREHIRKQEHERRHQAHLHIDRELSAVAFRADHTALTELATFEPSEEDIEELIQEIDLLDRARICALIGAAKLASYWADDMRRLFRVEVCLRHYQPGDRSFRGRMFAFALPERLRNLTATEKFSEIVDGNGVFERLPREERYFGAELHLISRSGEGSCRLNPTVFQERLYFMREMRRRFIGQDIRRNSILLDKAFPSSDDPFIDTLDDELIGVGFLYLDSLQFMLDMDATLPIISFSGNSNGSILVKVRSWIDCIETQPSYITVDKECNLSDYLNHQCLIRVYFEGLRSLPRQLCASTYVYFKFFFHANAYKTPRYNGISLNPSMQATISIEQKITRDFVEFVKTGGIEMEVFGKRVMPPTAPEQESVGHLVGEPKLDVAEDDDDAGDLQFDFVGQLSSPGKASYIERLEGGGLDGFSSKRASPQKRKSTSTTLAEAEAMANADKLEETTQQLEETTLELTKRDKALQATKKQVAQLQNNLASAEQEIATLKASQEQQATKHQVRVQLLETELAEAKERLLDMITMQKQKELLAQAANEARSRICVIS